MISVLSNSSNHCLWRCQNPRSNTQITAGKSCRLMTSKNLPWHGLTAQLFLKFLVIAQHEVPLINTNEPTNRSSNRTENGKCTDVTNHQSRVVLSTPNLHKPLLQLQDARFVLVRIFTVLHIYELNCA